MRSPTSLAWSRLFDELQLDSQLEHRGSAVLSADDIKRICRREPRLMTKFDTRESRPAELSRVTILPLSNGEYILVAGDGYADLQDASGIRHWTLPATARALQTLPWTPGPASESQALDMAYAAGILRDFFGDDGAKLTVRGRLRSPRFAFRFSSRRGMLSLSAAGVQIEVDAGYEGEQLHLVEAKLGARTNFHIRQLYYPLRMWSTLLPDKSISPVFLSWSNRCFTLRSFVFEPIDHYQSLRLLRAVDYVLDAPGRLPTLGETLAATELEPTLPRAPFPQADDARRVIDIVDAVAAGLTSKVDLALRYAFDDRQADYYGNAAVFLGLLQRTRGGFCLSGEGKRFSLTPRGERLGTFISQMARRPVFRETLQWLEQTGDLPPPATIADWVAAATGLRGKTPARRAGTVLAWARWVRDAVLRASEALQ